MDRDTAKEYILEQEPTFLERAPKKVGGRYTYICPLCGRGSWEGSAGISRYTSEKTGKIRYHCFTGDCGLDEDIIGLWKIDTGITDDTEAFNGLYDYYGIQIDGREAPAPNKYTHNSIHINTYTPTQEEEEEPEVDYTGFFLQANKDLGKTDYYRGIGLDTLNYFKVGYVEKWKHPKAPDFVQPTPRLIVPTSRYSYMARDTRKQIPASQEDYKKEKVGKVRIFNRRRLWEAEKPIFVLEGEIDALSVIDVGGEAIALGSTAYIKKLPELIKEKGQKPVQPLILALDNDKDSEVNAGQRAEEALAKMLDEEGISYYRLNIYSTGKDANEELLEDRVAFTMTIRGAEEQVIQNELEKKEAGAGSTMEEQKDEKKSMEEVLEDEKKEYLETSTANYIQGFINGIADSVNTPYIPTGFQKLDSLLDGGLFEGLYIAGAISSLGKTSLFLQIGDMIAEAGTDVLFFSLEMARSELMAKSISRLTLLDALQNNLGMGNAKTTRGITTGSRYEMYSQVEKDLIQRSIVAYSKYAGNIYIDEGVGDIGAKQIRDRVEKHITLTGKRPVVIIDYLQILQPADPRATDKQNMDKAVLELKRISREFKIPVIAISSLNRMSYKNEVTMEAYKESGAIEYSSDVLIGLQLKGAGATDFNENNAKSKDPREIELRILKNRNGRTGTKLELEYYSMFNYFKEV